jgi:hypothetical protein
MPKYIKGEIMKDNLQDLIEHTYSLGDIDLLKIIGSDTETKISAVAENKTVIIEGAFNAPNAEFIGTFGMPNLTKLKTILSFDDYDESANITVKKESRNGSDVPALIHFETKTGDFVNNYRLMSESLVQDKVKTVTFAGAVWNVEFQPTVAGIQRLKKQASANSEEQNFRTKVENGDLKIYFGDPSTHSGNFVFHPQVTGSLTHAWQWPVKQVIAILDLAGDKVMRISDQGVAEITVDSGLAKYRYLIPAQAK